MNCRHCGTPLKFTVIDLGSAPASNAYLTTETLHAPEKWYPLRVLACENCWLVQTEDFALADELFDKDYAYFSGYSSSWLAHCEKYVNEVIPRFGLGINSHVVEIAANDGSLLQYVKNRNIPCIGIEPTAGTAAAARAKGIPVIEEFFGTHLAREVVETKKSADLVAANNVLAHVPDINDFVAGVALLLQKDGVATFEFPHLLNLIGNNQFDTIYHEHYSYLSLMAVKRIFEANGLSIFDVEEIPTHGGSLRVFAQKEGQGNKPVENSVGKLLEREVRAGVNSKSYYERFQKAALQIKYDFLDFLLQVKREGKKVAAYGAAAKGNTLLNYAGVRKDMVAFIVDKNPAKQGKYMPGSRIPIVAEEKIEETKPDYVVVLPWNLEQEIKSQLSYIRKWGGKFVHAVPHLVINSD